MVATSHRWLLKAHERWLRWLGNGMFIMLKFNFEKLRAAWGRHNSKLWDEHNPKIGCIHLDSVANFVIQELCIRVCVCARAKAGRLWFSRSELEFKTKSYCEKTYENRASTCIYKIMNAGLSEENVIFLK